MIERAASRLASFIRMNGGDDKVPVAILRFALTLWFSLGLIFGISLAIGVIFNTVKDTLIVLLSIGVLRYFSGGWHLKTAGQCVVFTVVLTMGITTVPPLSAELHFLFNLLSLLLVAFFAPTGHGQRLTSRLMEWSFKSISLGVVLTSFFLENSLITISLLSQSLTLITVLRR